MEPTEREEQNESLDSNQMKKIVVVLSTFWSSELY
ncbi:hypothetical protein T07_14547 [Trichinella nelsoni]|uniref:Uncharacterized protein n=1 Tax=Trichinella nelsoni TaxID=6336 RepID=A0A0V0SEA4_9BILA|nr:hypothetical protein T07_14547 [Trichinella nelsoni]